MNVRGVDINTVPWCAQPKETDAVIVVKPDHFAKKCRTKAKCVNVVEICSSDNESEELFLGYISADIDTIDAELSENIEINVKTVRFQ